MLRLPPPEKSAGRLWGRPRRIGRIGCRRPGSRPRASPGGRKRLGAIVFRAAEQQPTQYAARQGTARVDEERSSRMIHGQESVAEIGGEPPISSPLAIGLAYCLG